MITVSILINGQPIYTRTAVNSGATVNQPNGQHHIYTLDTGEVIKHKQKDGAVVLAMKMLDTILEIK